MKTSTGKKISVIVRLPKTLVSSKEYQCVPVFIKVRAILVLVKGQRYEENQPTEQYSQLRPCRPQLLCYELRAKSSLETSVIILN